MANEINIVVSAQVGDATKGLMQVQQQVQRVDRQIKNSTKVLSSNANQYNRNAVATNKWAKGALQQAGYQVGDFAVQLSGGQNALQAFGQQGSQLLGIFGPVGAVLGAGVAIFAAFGVAVQRSGAEVSEMGKALGVLQEPLSQVAGAVKGLTSSFGSAFPTLVQNIDTALIAVGLFAGLTVAKMVPSMLAASGASTILSSAMMTVRASILAASLSAGKFTFGMVALRSAALLTGAAFKAVGAILMRFLPIAVLVGLAKMVELFMRLMKGAGGFGEAMQLLGELFSSVLRGMLTAATYLPDGMKAVWETIKAGFMGTILFLQKSWADFLHSVSRSVNEMPGVPDFVKQFLGTEAIMAGSKVYELEAAVNSLKESASDMRGDALSGIIASFDGTKEAYDKIKQAIKDGTEEVTIFGDATENAAIKGANALKDQLTPAMKQAIAVGDMVGNSMENAMMSIVDGTKSVKDAFKSMASEIIKELYRIFVVKKITGMISSFIADPAMFGGLGGTSPVNGSVMPTMRPSGVRAMGGQVTGNKAYMVGERGPEMIVPSRNSHVVPNNQMGGGGVTVVQNINVSTGVLQTVRT